MCCELWHTKNSDKGFFIKSLWIKIWGFSLFSEYPFIKSRSSSAVRASIIDVTASACVHIKYRFTGSSYAHGNTIYRTSWCLVLAATSNAINVFDATPVTAASKIAARGRRLIVAKIPFSFLWNLAQKGTNYKSNMCQRVQKLVKSIFR